MKITLKKMRNNARKTLKIIGVLLVVILVGGYAILKAEDYLRGTKIVIESPKDGITITDQFIEIRGQAKGASLLTLNGAKILTDTEGYFSQRLLLGLGYNTFEIKALDRFNREKVELLQLVYKPNKIETLSQNVQFTITNFQ